MKLQAYTQRGLGGLHAGWPSVEYWSSSLNIILDKFTDPNYDNRTLAEKINPVFTQARNDGSGTFWRTEPDPSLTSEFRAKKTRPTMYFQTLHFM
jgi:hypothetical protein